MEKQLFEDYPLHQRVKMLEDNAESIEERGFMKPFSPEEVLSLKDDLANVAIDIDNIGIAKKTANDGFKAELKPLEDRKKTILENIKNRSEYVKENCYKIVDHTEGMAGFYSRDGQLIESRQLRPDERQKSFNFNAVVNE